MLASRGTRAGGRAEKASDPRRSWFALAGVVVLAALVALPAGGLLAARASGGTMAAAAPASPGSTGLPLVAAGPDPSPNPGKVFATLVLANNTLESGNYPAIDALGTSDPVYDPNNGLIFFTGYNSTGNALYAWDPSTQSLEGVAPMPTGGFTAGVVMDVSDNLVYVLTPGLDQVQVVSGSAPFSLVRSVTVGTDPYAAAWDPLNDELFVANYIDPESSTNSNLTVLAGPTQSYVATIDVGLYPMGAVFDPAYGAYGAVLVANQQNNNLSVISPHSYTEVTSVPVGTDPSSLAYDPVHGLIYVANQGSGNLTVLHASSLTVDVASLSAGLDTSGLNVSASGKLYVTDTYTNNVSVVLGSDPAAGIVENFSVGSDPIGAAYDSGTGNEYITNDESDNVTVLDDGTALPGLVTVERVGTTPRTLAYSAYHNEYFVGEPNLLLVVNAASHEETGSVPLNITPYALLDVPELNELWVSGLGTYETGWLDVINEGTLEVTTSLDAHGSGPLAYDPDDSGPGQTSGTIFLGDSNGSLVGVDAATVSPYEALPVSELTSYYGAPEVGGMVWDGQTDALYLTDGPVNDEVTVISVRGALEFLTPLPVGAEPTGIVLDSSTGSIFVVNAEDGNLSEIDPLADSSQAYGGAFASFPKNLTYDSSNGLLYVVSPYVSGSDDSEVTVVDASSFVVAEDLDVGFGASGIVYASNEGNVSVANYDQGTLSLIGESVPVPPEIAVNPHQGPIGALVTVTGIDFSPGQILGEIDFGGVPLTGQNCLDGTSVVIGSSGDFSCELAVPSGMSSSTVEVFDDVLGPAATTFDRTTLKLSLDPHQGPDGASVLISGSGFSVSSELAALTFAGSPVSSCSPGSLTTSSSGAFACGVVVPVDTPESVVDAVATDAGGQSTSAAFQVTDLALGITADQGPVGASVVVTGTGFTVDSTVGLNFGGAVVSSCSEGSLETGIVTPGGFKCTVTVPSLGSGTVRVTATDVGGATVSANFLVTSPRIHFTPGQGPVGATVTVIGQGFSADAPVASLVFYTTPITSCLSGSLTTGSVGPGAFSCSFQVPAGVPAGYDSVFADDRSGAYTSASFLVTSPALSVSPTQGPTGASVVVTGTGFSVDQTVSLTFGAVAIAPADCLAGSSLTTGTLAAGGFKCQLDVPPGLSGLVQVVATDVGGSSAPPAKFAVTVPSISVSPGSGAVGSTVTVKGQGFSADTPLVSLVFDGQPVATCSLGGSLTSGSPGAGGAGAFSCSFPVPSGTTGTSVIATDASGAVASGKFVVTAPPSSSPASAVHLSWESVAVNLLRTSARDLDSVRVGLA